MKLFQFLSLGVLLSCCATGNLAASKAKKQDELRTQLLQQMNNMKAEVASSCGACSANVIPISQADINPNGYEITAPGVYCLTENIAFSPSINNQAAIWVHVPAGQASNVVIHLNGYTLAKNTSATGLQTTGILVDAQNNVMIDGGTVSDFDLFGVRVNGGSSNIVCQEVNMYRNGTNNAPNGGFSAANSKDIVVDRCIANNNIGIGLSLAGVQQAIVSGSNFDNNSAATVTFLGGSICWGAFATNLLSGQPCKDLSFIDCTSSNNSSNGVCLGLECIGIPLPGNPLNENVNIINCISNHNAGGMTGSFTQEGEGFAVIGVNNFVVKGCIAEGNHSNATQPSGIAGNHTSCGYSVAFLNTAGLIEDCQAINNSGNGDVSCGFRVMRSSDIVVRNCVAIDHTNAGFNGSTGIHGEAWGFTTDPDLGNFLGVPQGTNFTFDSCVATNNTAPGAPDGFGGGIKFISQVHSLITDCILQGNSMGIYVSDPACCQIGPGQVGSCCCLEPTTCCITTGPACCTSTTSNCACTNNACKTSSTCCGVSKENVVKGNVLIGNARGGIVDNLDCNSTAYYKNEARANGPNGSLNYVGVISPAPQSCNKPGGNGTPIRLWITPNAPCKKNNNGEMDPWDNMDIR